MASADWRDEERSFPTPLPELGRLARRSRHRIGLAILGAVAVAAAGTGFLVLRSGQHEAQVVLRVSEGLISDGRGMPRGELRGYVESALLTRPVLLEIIESEDLFPEKREQGEQFAIDALRSALDIDIYGNYFASWERLGQRSLRIRITYRSGDRDEAAKVARALARMIASSELDRRKLRFDESHGLSESIIARAEDRLETRQRELAEQLEELRAAEREGDRINAGALRLQAGHTAERMNFEHRSLRNALLEKRELDFRLAAARERLGILFTVVDETIPPPSDPKGWIPLAFVGGALFVLALPFAGIAAGAFDPRIHESDDVARLGLPAMGHVPPFRGHRLGAARSRR